MKEEALKLTDWLENMSKLGWADNFGQELDEISAMIRRLVERIDSQDKHLQGKDDLISRLVEELDEKNYRILELTKRYKALDRTGVQSISIEGGEL